MASTNRDFTIFTEDGRTHTMWAPTFLSALRRFGRAQPGGTVIAACASDRRADLRAELRRLVRFLKSQGQPAPLNTIGLAGFLVLHLLGREASHQPTAARAVSMSHSPQNAHAVFATSVLESDNQLDPRFGAILGAPATAERKARR